MDRVPVKNIVFLYSELMGYNIGIIKTLSQIVTEKVTVIHWDKVKKSEYTLPSLDKTIFIERSKISNSDIATLLKTKNPNVVFSIGCKKLLG